MSSFDEFYKKWKEKNEVTAETPYHETSNEEKSESANRYNQTIFDEMKAQTRSNNTSNMWNQVQNIANNNSILFNRNLNINTENTKSKNILDLTLNNKSQGIELNDDLIQSLASIDNVGERTNKIRGIVKDKNEQAKINLKVNEYIQQQKSQEEAQKINSDIQQGNYLSSIGHVLKGLPEGALNATINTGVALENIMPAPRASGYDSKGHVDAAKILTNRYQDTTSQINNGIIKTASNISGTIGQMIPSILANAMAPGTGNLVQAVNSGTSSYIDTLNENQDNKGKALLTGALKGAASYGIEKLTGGNFLGVGSLDDIAKKTIKSNISSNIGRRIASKIYEIGGEALEENLENQAGYVIDKLVNNKDITREQWLNDLGTTSRDTVLTTIVLNLFGLGGNTYKEIQNDENIDSNTKELVNKAEKIIKNENLSVNNNAKNQTKNAKTVNTQQDIANKINDIVKNDKYLSQEDKESMIYATNNLASNNQLGSNNTIDAINRIKQMSQLSQENSDKLDTGKKYLSGRKEIYNKYRNVTDYDNSIVQQAKNVVAPNKQGKRTKEQWLNVAKYIGTNIADKSNSEIQKIAYKSWQEENPNNSSTLNRQGQKYVKFMSDEWIDTIYDAVNEQRQKSGYVVINDTVKALDNFYNEITNNQTVQNNNIDTSSMNLVDSAKVYDLNYSDETIQSINQKLNDRGIASRFDENLFKEANGNINKNINAIWRTYTDENGNTKREVIFNPNGNTQDTMQQISIHELTHDLAGTKEFDELKSLILDRNKTMQGYTEARQSLENTYSQVYDPNSENFKSLVDDEEVADTLAQKLGDQEFVNSLSTEKPTVFKRIYDWVVDKVNKITGNKIEKVYWEDIKNKFENAYRQTYQGENSNQTKYSFVGEKGINNAIKQEPSTYMTVEQGLNRAKQMQKLGTDNESIRQNTGWFQDKNGDWKFEISDKSMKIKDSAKLKENTSYKLEDIIEHDDLFTMYPELKNYKVSFEDINTSGRIKLSNNEIKINNKSIKSKTNVEGTLIHEIQHAIQNIENFEGGRSSKRSKLAYYRSLGEIEASDTKTRFLNEKYRNKNIYNIPPESSKSQPQHKDLNNYLKNRNLLDKIKDSVYNHSNINNKNGENNYEYDIKQNYTSNRNKNNYEKMEEIKKESTRKEYDIENKNLNPTDNPDIRYLTDTNGKWQEFLDSQIGIRGKGKTIQELKLPTKETISNQKVDSYNVLYQDNGQISTMNLPVSEGGKVRKHYKSIMQSSNTSPEAKAIAKELMGTDTYVPDSNERQLEIADDRIERNGADNESIALATKVKNGDKITAEDIATGERLIEYYSKTGDREKLQDSIQNVALAGTQLGQAVQAMSLVNRQTPQGQAVYLQKVIDRMNNDIEKRTKGKGKKFELTPEMIEKITNSSKENLETNIDEVARELANQVPKTTIEKIDSWRYFSMLGNPKTHIRNVLGNLSMASVQTVKNKVAGGLEAIAQKTGMIDKRSKTLKPASRETRKFAKSDVNNVMARLNNESKFDTRNLIQQYQRTFKSDLLENTLGKLYNLNSKALEKEDIFGLKRAYRKSLADYMTANKLTESDLTAGTREADIQLEKARKYAIEQAQEATFHQQSAMASILNTFENKSTATRLITGAVIPFKKTPINVAKTGASYSPLGLVKSFTLDVANLKNGKITANQYIDNLAKGLTGTGIAAAGYALAQAGILSASGDEDDQKNQYYQEDRGNQPFSLRIGDKTYSLDWLAPTAIPLFIGAELNNNIKNSNEEQTAEDILDRISNGIDAMSSAMNPMIEMSMLSGLASTIKSFSQGDTQVFQNLAINAGKSYVNQFFPTLSGQIAKIVDDTERSTTSTKKNAFAKAVDSTGKQILNKIPFASQLLPAKTDVWGNTLKRDSNPFYRALQQTTFPWTEKNLKSTDVDNAISDLYEETGEKSVLPNTSINKDFTLNGEKYRLTSEEYAEYKKQYGKNSYNLLNGLTSSKEYKNMNREQKIEAISKVYEYANEKNKTDYANKNKVKIETSSLYNTVTSIEEEGGNGSDYFKYLGQITGVEKSEEKIKILEESDIPLKSKSSIYTNTVGKSDDFYSNVLKESNININEYLKYKQQKFESDKEDDGTLEGKSKDNRKEKIYNYVNGMNITYNQKLLILGNQYKLTDNEQKRLYQYINSIPGQTSDEKLEIFKMYTNNFQIYKDGTMSFK